jgi:hypothetical protein
MHPVIRTVLQRLGLGLLTLFAVSVIIFSTLEMLPGGFAEAILGQGATPETVAAFNKSLGLDRPPTTRYVEWVTGAVQGDFGKSFAGAGGWRVRKCPHRFQHHWAAPLQYLFHGRPDCHHRRTLGTRVGAADSVVPKHLV